MQTVVKKRVWRTRKFGYDFTNRVDEDEWVQGSLILSGSESSFSLKVGRVHYNVDNTFLCSWW